MAVWQDKKRKDWIYELQYLGERCGGRGFKTKKAALTAREERRKNLKKEAEQKTPTAFSGICNQYLEWSERSNVGKTHEYKALVLRRFFEFIKRDIDIRNITPQLLSQFLMSRPSNHNYNVHRKELSTVFTYARDQLKVIVHNPIVGIPKLPENKQEKKIPTREEFLRILAACDQDERPLLMILAHSLARIDEILRLTWQDVGFDRQTMVLWTRKNKAGEWKSRIIPMNQELSDMLESMWRRRKQEKWVFYNEKTEDRFNRRPKIMRSLCRKAGTPHYGFHSIRHFVATYLHDIMKVPTGVLSGILGHDNKRTTEIYLHSVDEARRQAMALLEGQFLVGVFGRGFDEKQG